MAHTENMEDDHNFGLHGYKLFLSLIINNYLNMIHHSGHSHTHYPRAYKLGLHQK